MKLFLLLFLFATSAFAADRAIPCQGASCAVLIETRDGSNVKVSAMKIAGTGKTEISVRTDSNCGIGNVCSGTYTPTLTNTTNVASSTASAFTFFTRNGDYIDVYGTLDLDPTSASTLTLLDISLPVATDITSDRQIVGAAVRQNTASGENISAFIDGSTGNDRAVVAYINDTDVASYRWSFHFRYKL